MTTPALYKTTYDRAACDVGLVHIGLGAFHRAHQSVYFDDYMQATGDLRWGIAAVNLRSVDSEAFAQTAKARDGYVLKSIAADGTLEYRAVRSHVAFVDAAQNLDAAVGLFAKASVKAASMTVTESGYAFKEDWSLDLTAPAVAAELAGGPVTTIYGFLAAGLEARARELNQPMTVLCCDNIRSNGTVLRDALLAYLDAKGKGDLADWTRQNVTFPCSMVDRITPRSTPELATEVTRLFPDDNVSPVHAEDFIQWVLQDDFAAEMPDLARAGVQVVDNVHPYEEAKIRILNGGHTGLCYFGALAGHMTFDAAMRDPELRAHFDRWETQEVLKGLGTSIPFDTTDYLNQIANRFENRGISDQLERICMDGYTKMAIYIRPTLRACLQMGVTPAASYDCAASWVVYARRSQAGLMAVPYHEPFWNRLEPILAPGRERDLASDSQMWGDLPRTFDSFVPDMMRAIEKMEHAWPA
jgi:D-arabinitol 4-dehydrogenase